VTARTGVPASQRKRPVRAGVTKRRRRLSLRDARIRAKLGVLLILPLAAVVALAGVLLVNSGRRALSAATVKSLTVLSADISEATNQLQKERMAAATLLSSPAKASPDPYNERVRLTEAAVATYTAHRGGLSGLSAAVSDRLARIDRQLNTLDTLRQQVAARQGVSVAEVVVRYSVVLDEMVGYHADIAQIAGNTKVADMLRAKAAFAAAKAQAAQEQAIGYTALQLGQIDQQQYSAFVATLTGQQSALSTFNLSATAQQRALVNNTITGDAVALADRTANLVAQSVGGRAALTATDLTASIGAVVDLMRWTEQQLDAGVLAEATAQQNSVLREVVIESLLVILTLIIAVLLAAVVARSMVRSLSGLREGALSVADHDLPAAVARLRDAPNVGEESPEDIVRQVVDPIRIDTRDEVGQVAQAFNVVHREAVRVAAEQAALRASVSAMFLNLARRSQALVDRIIGELDDIERGEEDPKRLSRLFQLDHLATRMRRNDENLLILAGADSGSPRRDDALLVDVVRAAQSEVELYNRIEFATIDQDVSVTALVVNDAVRLLAELLDNATRFSPPQTAVVVDARRIGDYVLLQIEDRGLGMTPEQMAMLNHRLSQPPTVDVAAFRMMGLAVVGRLAARHQMRVELRPNPDGGTITVVTLPTPVLILPRLRGREPVLPRPRTVLAVERGPSAEPPGWPMPSLPGLAPGGDGGRLDEMPVSAGASLGPATVNGWSHNNATDTNGKWPVPATVSVAPASPVIDALGYPSGTQRQVTADETAELPIFRAMEAVWFRSHSTSDELSASAFRPAATATSQQTASRPTVSASYLTAPTAPMSPAAPAPMAPPPAPSRGMPPAPSVPPAASPPPVVPAAAPAPAPVPPPPQATSAVRRDPVTGDESWRTVADDGWRAAAAASQPVTSGTTRSGLPKRVPAAQLVPGGVDQRPANPTSRRTPEEVRGLLSAYHRGVQRGRSGEDGRSQTEHRPADKETNR
jgi:signal transduction histidine kinase